jgi:cytidylate kinase
LQQDLFVSLLVYRLCKYLVRCFVLPSRGNKDKINYIKHAKAADLMPMKISITGILGSGKSTVCKQLTERYNLRYFSTGVIQRELAVKMGMTTYELNKYSETHPEIDDLIDGELIKLSDSPDDIVIDSRMAWHFVNDTFKVYLLTDETVAAERVMLAQRGPSEHYADTEQAREFLKARRISENLRYKQMYGVDCDDLQNYDLVIDTTNDASVVPPEKIVDIIIENYSESYNTHKANSPALFISPLCLYPTGTANDAASEITVRISGSHLFIAEGHTRVSELIKAGEKLVRCSIAAPASDDDVEFSLETAREWERVNGVKYRTYP